MPSWSTRTITSLRFWRGRSMRPPWNCAARGSLKRALDPAADRGRRCGMILASSTNGCWIGVVRPRWIQSSTSSKGPPADLDASKGRAVSIRATLDRISDLPEKSGRKCTEAALGDTDGTVRAGVSL